MLNNIQSVQDQLRLIGWDKQFELELLNSPSADSTTVYDKRKANQCLYVEASATQLMSLHQTHAAGFQLQNLNISQSFSSGFLHLIDQRHQPWLAIPAQPILTRTLRNHPQTIDLFVHAQQIYCTWSVKNVFRHALRQLDEPNRYNPPMVAQHAAQSIQHYQLQNAFKDWTKQVIRSNQLEAPRYRSSLEKSTPSHPAERLLNYLKRGQDPELLKLLEWSASDVDFLRISIRSLKKEVSATHG